MLPWTVDGLSGRETDRLDQRPKKRQKKRRVRCAVQDVSGEKFESFEPERTERFPEAVCGGQRSPLPSPSRRWRRSSATTTALYCSVTRAALIRVSGPWRSIYAR